MAEKGVDRYAYGRSDRNPTSFRSGRHTYPGGRTGDVQVDFNPDVIAYYRLIAPLRPDRVRELGCMPTVVA
jgi:hypothetical protein